MPIRAGAMLTGLLLGVGTVSGFGQSAPEKPSAAVSTLPAAVPTANVTDTASQTATAPEHHLAVDYTDGKLSVDASNASLNEVLREVSQKAGIKVVGSVSDEKVFGQYGPSAPSVILATLLDGTGSNMLLVDDSQGASQLILTPRRGGATPPNPNAALSSESEENGNTNRYVPPVIQYQPPTGGRRGPARANADGSPSFAPPTPPTEQNSDTSATGDGTQKTPQQIYDQLQKTMQQKANSTQSPQ